MDKNKRKDQSLNLHCLFDLHPEENSATALAAPVLASSD